MDNPFKQDWFDLFYNHCDPYSKIIREFSKWLFQNKETEIQLFHGTASIVPAMTEGLKVTTQKLGSF